MESHTCCTIVQDQNGALSCITLVKYPIPSIVPHDKMDKKYTIFGKKRVSLRFRRIRRNLREAAKTGPL